MRLHETPTELAAALAAHAPKRIGSLLDPAAGRGALLVPFLQNAPITRVVAVDKRKCCKDQLRRTFPKSNIQFVHDDFLTAWSTLGKFDCVVMNPPFDARRKKWVTCSTSVNGMPDQMPVEAAFVVRSIELLRSCGTLLAVLPASVISSRSSTWLRRFLLNSGTVHLVHELPETTFKNAEVTVYMVIFEKRHRTSSFALCNSSLATPQTIRVTRRQVGDDARLDYGFHVSAQLIRRLRSRESTLGWGRLEQLADVRRGSVPSPISNDKVIHTTAAEGPFWRTSERKPKRLLQVHTKPGDILLQRVGRFSSRSIGIPMTYGNRVSDCVFIVRPLPQTSSIALLFTLRVLLGCPNGTRLVQRGTGARFICSKDLQKLEIPATLHMTFPAEFSRFSKAYKAGDVRSIEIAESNVRGALGWNEVD